MDRFKPGDLVCLNEDLSPVQPVVMILRKSNPIVGDYLKIYPKDNYLYKQSYLLPATPEDFQRCSEEELVVLLQGKASFNDKETSL